MHNSYYPTDDENEFPPDVDAPFDESSVRGLHDTAEPASADTPEPAVVPVPDNIMPQPLSVPRVRRSLTEGIRSITAAMEEVVKLASGERVTLGPVAIDALVCGAHSMRYPLDDSPTIDRLRAKAYDGRFDAYAALALDELEDALAALEAARSALRAVSLLDEPIPGAWGNLPPVALARKIVQLGYTLLRGRIAGVSL